MSKEMLILIIGMGVVTYIPRMLPFVLLKEKELPSFLQAVLKNVPYATLGALIFPGILLMNDLIWFGIIGAITAFIVAILGANIIIVVLSSIIVLSIFSSIIS